MDATATYQRIYLVGFMGCGKSYLGQRLAAWLDWKFLDLDEAIVALSGLKDIPAIFASQGEAAFRKLEKQALEQTSQLSQQVIATGGGTPCQAGQIDWLLNHGTVIFLDASPQVLSQRLWPERIKRPLISHLQSRETLTEFIQELLEKRRPFYERAHEVVRLETRDV